MNQFRAVLMDLDGTLLDSAQAHVSCWLRVLSDFGYVVKPAQIRSRLGLSAERIVYDLCGLSAASDRAQQIRFQRERLLRGYALQEVSAFPGVPALLEALGESGAQLAVTSAASRAETFALLARAGLLTAFDHVICKEDVREAKPAPDAIRCALSRMGVSAEEALFVGSSPYDLAAAHAAMVRCVALKSGDWPEAALGDAAVIYAHPAEFAAHLRSSCFAAQAELPQPKAFSWLEPALWTATFTRTQAA